jgi:hypothetical protein
MQSKGEHWGVRSKRFPRPALRSVFKVQLSTVGNVWYRWFARYPAKPIGQDNLFFSPLSPTSYATVLEPAMSWSGNLWVWTPAIEVTHRFHLNDASSLVLQGGVLDPLT